MTKLSISAAVLATAAVAHAQTAFPEVEPNNNKAQATVVTCMTAGDSLTGTTTGLSTVAGATSLDQFRVKTCAAPAGVYQHRLTLTTPGPVGHVGTYRGAEQVAHVVSTTFDIAFQVSNTATSPARSNVWYGFGKQEEFYYRVTGTAATTAGYTATLTTTTPAPIAVTGSFTPGAITIDCVGQTIEDTDLWLYDANFNPLADGGSDEPMPPATVTGRPAKLTRTLAAGTYFVAISDWNTANHLPAPMDDAAGDEDLLEFPNALANNTSTPVPLSVNFSISDGTNTQIVTANKNAAFEVVFAMFTVGAPPLFEAFCTNGSLGTDHTTPCPCGNAGAAGNGCGHSFDANGANLAATGTAAADDVVLHSQFEPATSFTLFLQHSAAADTVFHDGVLCAGGTLIRLRGRAAVAGEAFFPNSTFPQDVTTTLSQRGGTFPGSGFTGRYSAWFRNASTTFCPPATANVTNGWQLTW